MFECFLFLYFMTPEDDARTIYCKKLLVVSSMASTVAFTIILIARAGDGAQSMWPAASGFTGSVGLFVQLLIEKKLRHEVVEAAIYCVSFSLITNDLYKLVVLSGERSWPYFVLLIDVCLVCRLPPRVARNLIAMLVVWLWLLFFENITRFGLYDFSFLPPQSERHSRVRCANLPCAQTIGQAMQITYTQLLIFLLDFYLTRGFANRLQKEHEKMNKVIAATEDIATSLSRFDLEAAEAIISTASLPPPLYDSFNKILLNLDMYRPYLPQSCLYGEEFAGIEKRFSSDGAGRTSDAWSTDSDLSSSGHSMLQPNAKRRCAYTVTNMIGSHKEISKDLAAYQDRFKIFMEEVLTYYSRVAGVVGVVVGDHVHASFNATKRCSSHVKSAVQGASELHVALEAKGIHVTTGVASGTAFCGSFGCSALMSVAMIGRPAVTAAVLQDFARNVGYKVVCSEHVYGEVSFAFVMKIILGKVSISNSHVAEECLVYELSVRDGLTVNETSNHEEWMYQLEEMPWETYNDAGKMYLQGRTKEAQRMLHVTQNCPAGVALAEAQLERLIVLNGPVWVYATSFAPTSYKKDTKEENHSHQPDFGHKSSLRW